MDLCRMGPSLGLSQQGHQDWLQNLLPERVGRRQEEGQGTGQGPQGLWEGGCSWVRSPDPRHFWTLEGKVGRKAAWSQGEENMKKSNAGGIVGEFSSSGAKGRVGI